VTRPVRVSAALDIDLSRTAERMADLIVAKLIERGLLVTLPPAGSAYPVQPRPTIDPAARDE
jgi:hypothetical protein